MAATSVLRELWDTTRMRLLVEIERQGSLSAAAAAIGIGQPSASRHLRLLEAAAGQRLVERSGRGSSLTEAGKVLAGRAAQALASLGAAEEELHALAGLQTGTIRIGASTAPGAYLLPDTLGCFRREFPGVTVEVEIAASSEILERLLHGRVQLAKASASPSSPATRSPKRSSAASSRASASAAGRGCAATSRSPPSPAARSAPANAGSSERSPAAAQSPPPTPKPASPHEPRT